MASTVGIDLGSYTIKAVEVKGGFGGNKEIVKAASGYNPTGLFLPTDEADFNQLAGAIRQLLSEHKMKGNPVYLGMPESMAHTSIVSMPMLSDAELASSIHWEAEQHIPVPLDDVNLEYEILYRPKKSEVGEKMKVLLVAAQTEMIDRLVALFQGAGVEVIGLETVLLGIYRALKPSFTDQGAVLVCHMGALSTDILIVHKADMVLSYTIQSGGLALTRAIERGLELPPNQAEEYKRAYGLDPSQLEGRVRQSMSGVMNVIVGEIRKAMQYYQTAHTMSPIRSMWLSGGTAYVPGMAAYLAEAFSYEVDIVNPFATAPVQSGFNGPDDAALYTAAVGFALQED